MRNIFDQYAQPENRLTHALVSCLAEDRKLLHYFIRWVTGVSLNRANALKIVEQQLPGELEVTEVESVRRGLPDAWIHDGESWSLLIESKISASLQHDQLSRHLGTALRRGFDDVTVLAIDVIPPRRALPGGVRFRQWTEIYQWLASQSKASTWARRAAEYLEVAEAKLTEDGYLREGTLTVFSGIPFDDDEPYNYVEAKRLLKLAMPELRSRRYLARELGMNPNGLGRGAITGKAGAGVWDYLRLGDLSEDGPFNKYPHLTFVIGGDRVMAMLVIPHGAAGSIRRNVVDLGYDGFRDLMMQVNRNLIQSLRKAPGAAPWVEVLQRRYKSQRAVATLDAKTEYDLRTAFPEKKAGSVRLQPQWLAATYEALAHKRSNLQVAVGAVFPYRTCKATGSKQILDHVANSWLACKPIVDVLLRTQE